MAYVLKPWPEVARQISFMRAMKELTQAGLAAKMDPPAEQPQVSRWEGGKPMAHESLDRVIRALEADWLDFVETRPGEGWADIPSRADLYGHLPNGEPILLLEEDPTVADVRMILVRDAPNRTSTKRAPRSISETGTQPPEMMGVVEMLLHRYSEPEMLRRFDRRVGLGTRISMMLDDARDLEVSRDQLFELVEGIQGWAQQEERTIRGLHQEIRDLRRAHPDESGAGPVGAEDSDAGRQDPL